MPRDQFELSYRDLAAAMTDQKIVRVAAQRGREKLPEAARTDELSLTSDADYYRSGDGPVFTIASTRDCYLTLTNVDEKGEGTVLLPNRFQQDNLISAGRRSSFPGANAPFQFRTKDKGVEKHRRGVHRAAETTTTASSTISRARRSPRCRTIRARSAARSRWCRRAAAASGSSAPAPTAARTRRVRERRRRRGERPAAPGAGREFFRAAIQVTVR